MTTAAPGGALNVYGIDVSEIEHTYWIDYESYVGYNEYDSPCYIVAAETVGKARAEAARQADVEFTWPMKITLIATNYQGQPGQIDAPHTAWMVWRALTDPTFDILSEEYGIDEYSRLDLPDENDIEFECEWRLP